ncbi:PepSY domain-containing protein [Eubacterium multiforme]|uniref:Membrane protein YkoI n=1 Tax=Eubacterium multiforme TaxID=83339 RepID=A0ABT9UT29_9FIRM|nr:PepSY domain-containing protein [Eubacterium multiforme]MDQ0149498.1 putative membrane protein YkoI [Eubacterium multiforme]
MDKNNNINENNKDTEIIEVKDMKAETNNENKEVKNKKNKFSKRKIIGLSILAVVIGGAIAAGAAVYDHMEDRGNNPIEQAKEKVEMKFAEKPNYSLDQAKEIALKKVNGTVVKSKEDVEDGIVEYEFKIKDKENLLQEITVDGKTGAIVDIDNPLNDHKKDDDHHND